MAMRLHCFCTAWRGRFSPVFLLLLVFCFRLHREAFFFFFFLFVLVSGQGVIHLLDIYQTHGYLVWYGMAWHVRDGKQLDSILVDGIGIPLGYHRRHCVDWTGMAQVWIWGIACI